MEKVNELIQEIREGLTQKGSSQKDEIKVMRSMLNDRDYEIGVYTKDGLQRTLSPAKEAREMIGSVISSATSIKKEEAQKLADDYDFKKSEAVNMVNISKEFVNTYLQTGRRLPLGGRETFNASLKMSHVEPSQKLYPVKVGIDENGKDKYTNKTAHIPEHDVIKSTETCPIWLKK